MKHFSLIVMAALYGWMVHAQTNATGPGFPASATTNSPAVPPLPRAPTRIYADRADFDLAGHQVIYRGHVRVDDPQMKLTGEWLVADMPQGGGRPNHIVAVTNVVIDFMDDKGQTNHATSDKAVYDFQVKDSVTNETVTLTGDAKVENAQGSLAGEPIIDDFTTKHIRADNPRMIFRQNLNGASAVTNDLSAPKKNDE